MSGHDAGMTGHDAGTTLYSAAMALRILQPNGYAASFLTGNSVPAPRITMRKIKDVLRLKLDAKLSHQQIADALGLSKGVVTKYAGLAAAAGLDWGAVQAMDEAALERRLLAGSQAARDYVQPDYGCLHQELRRKGMTLMLLWEEHRADHADGQTYAYSQFCENYRRFAKQLKRSMRQAQRAGEKLFIDYAGPPSGSPTAAAPTSSWPRWENRATPTPAPRSASRWPTGSNRRRARSPFTAACPS